MKELDIKNLNEDYYANLFEFYLKYKAYDELPEFNNILREIPCKQGIADFICYNDTPFLKKHSEQIFKLNQKIGKIFIPILSALLIREKQSLELLVNNTGYDKKRLKKVLSLLKSEKIVKETLKKEYSLYASWKNFDVKLWAFELKLKNWKRALYQATQYQAFTDQVYTVFPMQQKELLLKKINYFKSLKVGCIVQDCNDKKIEILYQPASQNKTLCNTPYLYTLTEVITKELLSA